MNKDKIKIKKFTMVELLVIIVIIALLAVMLLPALSLSRERARRMSSANNLRQIGTAVISYSQDYNEKFPNSGDATCAGGVNTTMGSSVALLQNDLKNANALIDPSVANTITTNTWTSGSIKRYLQLLLLHRSWLRSWQCRTR